MENWEERDSCDHSKPHQPRRDIHTAVIGRRPSAQGGCTYPARQSATLRGSIQRIFGRENQLPRQLGIAGLDAQKTVTMSLMLMAHIACKSFGQIHIVDGKRTIYKQRCRC